MQRLSILLVCLWSACTPRYSPEAPGQFLSEVVNLEEFNSEYDDYNSNLPNNRFGHAALLFSSKRDRKEVFNLVYSPGEFTYSNRLNLKKYTQGSPVYDYFTLHNQTQLLLPKVNGNFNVYGPYTLTSSNFNFIERNDLLLFYADDASGNMDMKYVSKSSEPKAFELINSTANDGYPSFSSDGDRIYFSSDREGTYDIYELKIKSAPTSLDGLIHPKEYTLRKVEELSSPYQDKCPYLYRDLLVFVSDRPGGQGGQDIYYATYENGKWSQPTNAGARINTSSDEYRPILPDLGYTYPLMLFSSNRPGGKGGFDLYMTGLK